MATLYAFSRLLGVPIDALFENQWVGNTTSQSHAPEKISRDNFKQPTDVWESSGARISSVNPQSRSAIVMNSGVRWERLAATSDQSINFMEIIYQPGSESNESGALLVHDGYEYGYALDGEIEITIGDVVMTLTKGHSIGFDSTIPHKFRNTGQIAFKGIWLVHGCTAQEKSAKKA